MIPVKSGLETSTGQTMAEGQVRTGSCLCGGVRYRTTGELRNVIYCHCSQCRKTSGHFVAATGCAIENFELLNAESLLWYRASEAAERGFCGVCGGNLFWKPDHGERISMFAGTLDVPTKLVSESHIFVADKSDYHNIADGLPQHLQSDL